MVAMQSRPSRELVVGTLLFKPELHHVPSQIVGLVLWRIFHFPDEFHF